MQDVNRQRCHGQTTATNFLPLIPLLPFASCCVVGRFLRRQKRFSVALELEGQEVWVHSNNSGSMLGLLRKGAPVLASKADNPRRTLAYTQEAVWLGDGEPKQGGSEQDNAEHGQGFWVGVNTTTPNRLLAAAFAAHRLPFVAAYGHMQAEARRGDSRLDAVFTSAAVATGGKPLPPLWVECKNVTMVEDDVACFPDAVTERGQKHLRTLMDIVRGGERAAMFYLVQRADGYCFGPADVVDAAYATLFWQAVEMGVEIYAYRAHVSTAGIDLGERIPLLKKLNNVLY